MNTLTPPNTKNAPIAYTVSQLQRQLQLSRAEAYKLVHQQGFPIVRFGRVIRTPRDALLKWLEEQANKN